MREIILKYLDENRSDFKNSVVLDVKDWPEDWKSVSYKTYKRYEGIPLSEASFGKCDLLDIIHKRNSNINQGSEVIDFDKLSYIIYNSVGKKKDVDHRMYPSGGGRYPLELYVFVMEDLVGLANGIYHYNVLDNALERIFDLEDGFMQFTKETNDKIKSKVFLVFSSFSERTDSKYKSFSLKFSYIENGAAGQNVQLLATSLNINSSWLNHNDEPISKILDIDPDTEFISGVLALDF